VVNPDCGEADMTNVARRKQCSKCGKRKPVDAYYVKIKQTGRRFSWCKDCHKRTTNAYYYANHDEGKRKRAETQRQKYKADPEKYKAIRCAFYRANLTEERERSRRYDAKRADKRILYREKTRAERKKYNAAWKKANKDKVNLQNHRRRVRIEAAGDHYTVAEWGAIKVRYGGRCLCCGRKDVPLTVDHVVPLSRGGSNGAENLQPLCFTCNDRKGTRTIDYRPRRASA
jgi:5-methylcytosine-specific restriction endonuclease McrA